MCERSMRVGIVSDIHGNAAALRRAVDRMGSIDELWCLGDCINEYRFSNEVVDYLRNHASRVIHGNHEEVFFGQLGVAARAAPSVDPTLMAWLRAQPLRSALHQDDWRILLVHSTPWTPTGAYVCEQDPAFARFGSTPADLVLYGHTHRAVAARVGDVLVVNPGSAGEPRWHDDHWVCSYALLDTAAMSATLLDFAVPGSVSG